MTIVKHTLLGYTNFYPASMASNFAPNFPQSFGIVRFTRVTVIVDQNVHSSFLHTIYYVMCTTPVTINKPFIMSHNFLPQKKHTFENNMNIINIISLSWFTYQQIN